jgi:gamma-glutamylcyclotransferase (GGCT)/AIG2-like uncharacterized protein YtfP
MASLPWTSRQLLFAYGSLLRPTGYAGVDAAMAEAVADLGPGYILGMLHDLGAYPGAVPSAGGTGAGGPAAAIIRGKVFAFADPEPILRVLDVYEDFDPQAGESGEFVRAETRVFLTPGYPLGTGLRDEAEGETPMGASAPESLSAWTYYYNRPVQGFAPVPDGDWLAWLGRREARP